MAVSETYEKGRELRRQLLGDAYVERVNQTAYADPLMKTFIDLATEDGTGTCSGTWGSGGSGGPFGFPAPPPAPRKEPRVPEEGPARPSAFSPNAADGASLAGGPPGAPKSGSIPGGSATWGNCAAG